MYTKDSRNVRRKREIAEIAVRMVCLAVLVVIVCVLLVTPASKSSSEGATDRAAMVAAAARYDDILEQTGDRFMADTLAQELYLELGGTRDYWQGVAGE